jgi:HAMP domain-containing protein
MLRTIKFKMIVLIAASLGLGALAVTWRFDRVYEDNVALLSRESIQGAAAAFADLERTNTNLMAAALEVFLRDPNVAPAVAASDHDRLVEVSTPVFKEFKARYGLTNWNWWQLEPAGEKPKGLVNIARVQMPQKHGDMVEREATQRIAAERQLVTGLDLGFTGLGLRALLPVRQDGNVVGYVEWGMEIKTFLETMKKLSGNEYGLVVGKDAMNRDMWASTKKHLGDRDNWNDMPGLLLVQNTAGDPGIFNYAGNVAEVPEEGLALEIVEKDGRMFSRGVFPIHDMAGKKVGGIFVLRDVTSLETELAQSRRHAVVLMSILMVVLALVLITVFERLVVRRLDRMTQVATRVVGGDYNLVIVPAANDEIGAFETLFEQFRTLFVESLGQAQGASEERNAAGGEVRR